MPKNKNSQLLKKNVEFRGPDLQHIKVAIKKMTMITIMDLGMVLATMAQILKIWTQDTARIKQETIIIDMESVM